jgi:hypothetical protein
LSFGIGIFSTSNVPKTIWRRRRLSLLYRVVRKQKREVKIWTFHAQVQYSESAGRIRASGLTRNAERDVENSKKADSYGSAKLWSLRRAPAE